MMSQIRPESKLDSLAPVVVVVLLSSLVLRRCSTRHALTPPMNLAIENDGVLIIPNANAILLRLRIYLFRSNQSTSFAFQIKKTRSAAHPDGKNHEER
jgi:hypothetical protein